MAKRAMWRRRNPYKPNLIWICSAGEIALVQNNSVYDAIIAPGDWSGTVSEQSATLERINLMIATKTITATGIPHMENFAIVLGDASATGGSDVLDVSNWDDWPSFFSAHDEGVLHVGRIEFDGTLWVSQGNPVQFSQLPDPVVQCRTRRRLTPGTSVRLYLGGNFSVDTTEVHTVTWFARSLVRIGVH